MNKFGIVSILLFFFSAETLSAQYFERVEPEMQDQIEARSPFSEGLINGMSFNIEFNDFGIGIGGQYRRGISFLSELVLDFEFTALKDEREQEFQTIFGQQIIPNKYQRALTFPVMLGLKRRFFAEQLSDNFRIYTQTSLGVAPTFLYPYFDDSLGLGYIAPNQIPNDVFQGWGDGSFEFGLTGLFGIGIDFGDDFRRFQSVRFSYLFFYFPEGIQLMEPGSPTPEREGFTPNYFFGSPSITLKFGGMW